MYIMRTDGNICARTLVKGAAAQLTWRGSQCCKQSTSGASHIAVYILCSDPLFGLSSPLASNSSLQPLIWLAATSMLRASTHKVMHACRGW